MTNLISQKKIDIEKGFLETGYKIPIYIGMAMIAIRSFIPFWIMFINYFVDDYYIALNGYKLVPEGLDLKAYEVIFRTMLYLMAIKSPSLLPSWGPF